MVIDRPADGGNEPHVHAEAIARSRAVLQTDATYRELAQLFGALAEPTRARVIHLLMHEELCTKDLAAVLGLSDSVISQHLRILRALRLVKSRRAGKYVFYSVDDAHVALLVQVGLTHQGHDRLPGEDASSRVPVVASR